MSSTSTQDPISSLLLPRPDGTTLDLSRPCPFEPLAKGNRWDKDRISVLQLAVDCHGLNPPSWLRAALAAYLGAPSARVTSWISAARKVAAAVAAASDERQDTISSGVSAQVEMAAELSGAQDGARSP